MQKAVLEAVRKILGAKQGTRTAAELQKYLHIWQQKDENGQFQPYAGVAIYWLKKRLYKC